MADDEKDRTQSPRPAGRSRPRKRRAAAAVRPIPADIQELPTKAARIRALAALGWERAEIARALGVRYQQVYNALASGTGKAKPARRTAAVESAAATRASRQAERSTMAGSGAQETTPYKKTGDSSETTEREDIPWHRLWRLLALIVFGVVLGAVAGLLWLAAVAQVFIGLVRRTPSRTIAGLERRLGAYLAQIVRYFRDTDETENLPFPFSDPPRGDES